jgi:hypothetical protein
MKTFKQFIKETANEQTKKTLATLGYDEKANKVTDIPLYSGVKRNKVPVGSLASKKEPTKKEYSWLEKHKKDAEQTYNYRQKEPKQDNALPTDPWSLNNPTHSSSPKEKLTDYAARKKEELDRRFISKGTKNWNALAAYGYDTLKDKKTGVPAIDIENDPAKSGSYLPGEKRIKVEIKSKPTTRHEFGHVGSVKLNRGKYDPDTEEMRQRDLDTRSKENKNDRFDPENTQVSDAKSWWKSLKKGKNPNPLKNKLSSPLGDRDKISIEKTNDRLISMAKKELSKKYFRGGRETHSDSDLISSALGSTIPTANKHLSSDNKK